MKRYNTGYYIREGVSGIFAHGFMSFASVCIIVACLIIMGSFSLLSFNVSSIIGQFEKDNVVIAYVSDSLSEDQARALQSQIEALPNVESAQFTTREEAMQKFEGNFTDKSLFENIDSSVFRHRFYVYMQDISLTEQTTNDIRGVSGIAEANSNLAVAQGFVTVRNIVRIVSFVLVAILLVISLFIMSNTIKLATFDRREEIAIMKMVGATNGFIRWPFVFQGFILGLAGALVAFIAQWILYTVFANMLLKSNAMSFITAVPFSSVAIPMFAVFIALGFGVGVAGSAMAIKNYLRV
ncbi:cell division transport system permease protein [Sporobacter termitidis DSM 10068]|uniref:Cell division protein FtsX n=1 Tax=Sporobacter termitidis DSM 10068 TaxID=1123282 RepID=A0A1M5UM32_9FIRM|nr:permease-like cell division protein FtsX [Sporobacter termitidis]SHH63967.1 cell division transport system permease protein [Sporobacter termitidis DSM 10068]